MTAWRDEKERYLLTRNGIRVAEFAGDFARDAAFGAFWAVVSKWQGDGHVWHLIRVWHRTQPQVLLKYSAGVLSGEVD